MLNIRWSVGLLAGCLLLGGAAASAQTVTPKTILDNYIPRQPNIDCTTPSAAEVSGCEVKQIGDGTATSGWMLVDSAKKPLRRLFAYSVGNQRVSVLSFYKDGLEVYREIDTDSNGKANEYRWFNSGGMKWGVDVNEDGKIDSWKMINEGEVAQEVFQAVVTKDFARLQALLVTETELKALGLTESYMDKIRAKLQDTNKQFLATCQKVTVADIKKATGRVESAIAECVPGESIGTSHDLFRYPTLAILYEAAPNRHEWLQTGEMVKVGMAWRLIEAPFTENITKPDATPDNPILAKIAEHDKTIPNVPNPNAANAAIVAHYLKRIELIDSLLPTLTPDKLEGWYKQKSDNLQAAALASPDGDTRAVTLLRQFKEAVVKQSPQSNLSGYLTYRMLWSEYAPKLAKGDAKTQAEWLEKLVGFVKDFSRAEDTPDALIQLAMGSEFANKDDDAKRYYGELAQNFPQHPMAAKAQGAINRLNLVGHKMELATTTAQNQLFNMDSMKGKVVAVYYWASYCKNCEDEFTKLKKLRDAYGAKGFEVVCVNLDTKAADMAGFLQANPLTAIHLFTPTPEGSMESPLAIQYGIMGLPAMFLIGKDGNVISRTIQINDLEDAIKKAQN